MRRTSHPSFVFLLIHLFVSDKNKKNKKIGCHLFTKQLCTEIVSVHLYFLSTRFVILFCFKSLFCPCPFFLDKNLYQSSFTSLWYQIYTLNLMRVHTKFSTPSCSIFANGKVDSFD